MNLRTINVDDCRNWPPCEVDWFLFSISYEARSPVIRRAFKGVAKQYIGFCNTNHDYNSAALAAAKEEVANLKIVSLNSDAPLVSLDLIRDCISSESCSAPPSSIVLDITCFTREALAILIMTLRHLLPATRIYCMYNKASSYGDSPKDREHHGWLSRGFVGIRSILGYRGRVSLIAETHLILLPGFESERAHSIIDALQPNRLTIGHSQPEQCIRPEFAPVAGELNEKLVNYYPDRNIAQLRFSSRDPGLTRDSILRSVSNAENTIVACLNTKLAMMGVIMAALLNKDIQLIYAQPIQYNVKGLSNPSDELIAFEFA